MIPLKTTTDFIKTSAEDLNAIMEYNEVTKSPNYNEFTRGICEVNFVKLV